MKKEYTNLMENIKREKEEYSNDKINKIIAEKYKLKESSFKRVSLSVSQTELDLVTNFRSQLATLNFFPNLSLIYRAGLQALNKLNLLEVKDLINLLT